MISPDPEVKTPKDVKETEPPTTTKAFVSSEISRISFKKKVKREDEFPDSTSDKSSSTDSADSDISDFDEKTKLVGDGLPNRTESRETKRKSSRKAKTNENSVPNKANNFLSKLIGAGADEVPPKPPFKAGNQGREGHSGQQMKPSLSNSGGVWSKMPDLPGMSTGVSNILTTWGVAAPSPDISTKGKQFFCKLHIFYSKIVHVDFYTYIPT